MVSLRESTALYSIISWSIKINAYVMSDCLAVERFLEVITKAFAANE